MLYAPKEYKNYGLEKRGNFANKQSKDKQVSV